MESDQQIAKEGILQRITKSLGRYTDPKRLVMLVIFSFVAANSVYLITYDAAKTRIKQSSHALHSQIYRQYELLVDANKKKIDAISQGMEVQGAIQNLNLGLKSEGTSGSTQKPSAWWMALNSLKSDYADKKISILVKKDTNTTQERNFLNNISNKPKGYTLVETDSGWVTSHFVLPTKNLAVLSIHTYVRDQLASWDLFSLQLSSWVFFVFMVFGWFWTRAQEDAQAATERIKREIQEQVHDRLQLIKEVVTRVEYILKTVEENIGLLDQTSRTKSAELTQNISESVNNIHLLAINGTIESLKNEVKSNLFHSLLQEINKHAMQIKRVIDSNPAGDSPEIKNIREQITEVQSVIRKIA